MCCKELFGATWKFRNGWASEAIIFLCQILNSYPLPFWTGLGGEEKSWEFWDFVNLPAAH